MISPPDHRGHGEISVREPERLFQQSESSSADMECGFGEARHEHIRIEDGGRIFERWRTLTREPQAPQQMMEELNNTVDALIAHGRTPESVSIMKSYPTIMSQSISAS